MGLELEVYAVSLIEHKSDVDYDVVMQLLHYISNIWRDYARSRQHQTDNGNVIETSKAKAFRYPPVLPIVYYEGKRKWTAGMQLRDRVLKVEGLEEFMPDLTYKLVRIHDYSNADLLDKADEMSLIMLLNRIQTPEDMQGMLNISGADINEIVKDSEENVLTIIRDVVYLLCRKMNLSADETRELLTQLKEGRNMGYLFENMEHMDIQAERQERMQTQKRLEDVEKRLGDTENELNEAYKSCLRLCKRYSRQKEEAIKELLENSSLTPEAAWEVVNRYWDIL